MRSIEYFSSCRAHPRFHSRLAWSGIAQARVFASISRNALAGFASISRNALAGFASISRNALACGFFKRNRWLELTADQKRTPVVNDSLTAQ